MKWMSEGGGRKISRLHLKAHQLLENLSTKKSTFPLPFGLHLQPAV